MALMDRFPRHVFSSRGWGLLAAGALALLAAHITGRRDLLALATLLICLPLLALAGTRLLRPQFRVYREFSPSTVETSARSTVRLAVARSAAGSGHALMEERLPPRFGESPAFRFPSRSSLGGTSYYEYHLRSRKRGQFLIGPVTAEISDPFGLARRRQAIDDGDLLTVTPAAVDLSPTGLAGARGYDGATPTRAGANPSNDDIMTREYRQGDPMRRVHWPATARHGALMVRQEESVATPEATIIMDQRRSAYPDGGPSPRPGARRSGDRGGHEPVTCDAFEWAVTAVMSVSAHLSGRNYKLRCLDVSGSPAFLLSPSAPEPAAEEYAGASGLQSVAESLAAIQLSGAPPHRRDNTTTPDPVTGVPVTGSGPLPFDDRLMDKLAAHRQRGPILAVTGMLTLAEARALSPAAGLGANAFAIVITDGTPDTDAVLDALRLGGWRAVAVTAATALPSAWAAYDEDTAGAPAAAGQRGAGDRR
ncbi:MAG: DUF58 domain-containing protein [Arthrobacter oryzae]